MTTRRERVVLDLEDRFTPGMVKAAAATGLLNRELGSLSRDSVRTRRAISDIDQPAARLGKSSESSSKEVDKLSGRLRILTDVALILGPSLIPIGAVGVPAVAGLAAQLGFAATGAGVAILAFQGVGDALKALNAAGLNPTQQNLDKAQYALERLSPAAQGFVAQLGHMLPELTKLRDLSAEGLFPGATIGLHSLETALPHVQGVIAAVSSELGTLAEDAGASLASEKWTSFLDFLAKNAPQALGDMAHAAGNTAHAVAALWMATDPLNDDFSSWLVTATGRLDAFASGLSKTQGYAEFIDYVEKNGPQVGATLGAIANAALQIVEAAAPLGGPVLKGVEALANITADLANSDLGTPIFTAAAAMALFNRTLSIAGSMQKQTFGSPAVAQLRGYGASIRGMSADFQVLRAQQAKMRDVTKGMVPVPLFQKGNEESKRLAGNLKSIGKTAAGVAGVAVAASGVADKIGLSNTASLALIGTLGGPWGAAAGAAIGSTLDLKDAVGSYTDSLGAADRALESNSRAAHEAALAGLQQQAQYLATSNSFKANVTRIFAFAKAHATGIPGADPGHDLEARADKLKQALKMDSAVEQQHLLAQGFIGTATGIDHATESTRDFARELQSLNDFLTGRANMRDFEAAIDDFTAGLKKNGKALDINTKKGRENQANLDGIAASALKVAETLQGNQRATFLDAARASFVKAAEAAGMTKAAAKSLADEVLGLKNVTGKPKIVIDANGAWRVIDDVQARLNQFHDKTIRLTVLQNLVQANKNRGQVADVQQADGGTVPGMRHPYGDKVLAYLAPGEEVITNRHGEADRFRADRAAGRIPAYADGGTAARMAGAANGSAIDYHRLAAAITGDRANGYRDTRDALLWAMRMALRETPVQRAPRDPLLAYGAL